MSAGNAKAPTDMMRKYVVGTTFTTENLTKLIEEYKEAYAALTLNLNELDTLTEEIKATAKTAKDLVKLHDRIRLNNRNTEYLNKTLKGIEATLADEKRKRSLNSENNLLFLPKTGKNQRYQLGQLQRIPNYIPGQNTLMEVWQYVSRFATMHDLTEEATLRSLAGKMPPNIRKDIEEKMKTHTALSVIIERIQNKYEKFPTPEEWKKGFEEFERKKGEDIASAVARWKVIGFRRYHDLTSSEAIDKIRKHITDKFNTIISIQTKEYIDQIEKKVGGFYPPLSILGSKTALAINHERVNANRGHKYKLSDDESIELLLHKSVQRADVVTKINEIIGSIEKPPNHDSIERSVRQLLSQKEESQPQTLVRTYKNDEEILHIKYMDRNSFIDR